LVRWRGRVSVAASVKLVWKAKFSEWKENKACVSDRLGKEKEKEDKWRERW